MFKTNKECLDKLVFYFSEQDISTMQKLMHYFKRNGMVNISNEEFERCLNGLEKISELQMNEKIYGFWVKDTWVGEREGVELYSRRGNELRDLYVTDCRPDVYSVQNAIDFLQRESISKIYTGRIIKHFLDLPSFADDRDPILRNMLMSYQIDELRNSGIEVIVLDHLS